VKKQDEKNVDDLQATPKGDIVINSANKELKDEIESELKCAICIVFLTDAKTATPCMHNFCKLCIEKLMKTS
jgi:hypothetical protein